MKSLLSVAVGLLILASAPNATAQCPGGVCPYTPGARAAQVVIQPRIAAQPRIVRAAGPHWTYPGEIHNHLATGHGINAAGMTRQQAEAEHDRLHNAQRGYGASRPVASQSGQRVYQRAQTRRVRWFRRR